MKQEIEIIVNETVQKVKRFELPYYTISKYLAYKVISKDRAIQIMLIAGQTEADISFRDANAAFQEGQIQCTREEVEQRFNKAIEILTNQFKQ